MIRAGLGGALLGLAASGALAAEGGAIRGGEHDGFTRIVLTVDPRTEWSLETAGGIAALRFPGRTLDFATTGVFDKIPRTRVTGVTVTPDPAGTLVTVALGCDCRVSTSFVGARYLALDVADRDAQPARVTPPPAREETADARAAREATVVASAEQALIRQIERAASQGIVRFSGAEDPDEPDGPGQLAIRPASPEPDPVPAPAPVPRSPADATDLTEDVLAAFAGSDQVLATTVYDRDGRNARTGPAPVPEICLDDTRLDVGSWSSGLSFTAQLPALNRQLVSEFDTPNPDALLNLARLYLRFGLGAEAEALLAAFPQAPVEDRPILVDLARAVENRPLPDGGPLSAEAACPGNHGLWQALGGTVPAYRDAGTFAGVQAAFAALPVDLRVLLAPGLIGRLIDAGHIPEARLIEDTALRPGEASDPGLDLAAARLLAAEGRPAEAIRALTTLIEGHAPVDALTELAGTVVAARIPVPDRIVTDLRAAALQYRGAPPEIRLRTLLVQVLAQRSELPLALDETRSARRDLPAAAPAFDALMLRLLASADPATVGPAAYAETALAAADIIAAAPPDDPARAAIGAALVDLGLPDPALLAVAPAVAAGGEAARVVAARAELGRGDGDAARLALGPLDGAQASGLRARAFALSGAYGEALATLDGQGLPAEAAPYAWPSGAWTRVRALAATDDPDRFAMASYMRVKAGAAPPPAPAADPDALTPDLAFQEPLPPLDRPSLDAARRLLSAGGKIGGFVEGVLADDATPAP